MSDQPLHDDDPDRDGNLTADQYAATYDDPDIEVHGVPADVVADIETQLDSDPRNITGV